MSTNPPRGRAYTLAELRAMTPEQRAALMPTAARVVGELLAAQSQAARVEPVQTRRVA